MGAQIHDGVGLIPITLPFQFEIVEGELDDVHAGEMIMVAEGQNLWAEVAEILGDDGQTGFAGEEFIEKGVAWSFDPFPFHRGRAGRGDLPIGVEGPEMIEAKNVVDVGVP